VKLLNKVYQIKWGRTIKKKNLTKACTILIDHYHKIHLYKNAYNIPVYIL